ncbi:Hsp20/alpha crystallin family protein [Kribbella sp. VKM Ac-2568]|uniref:Hsp20/alpha crystallin family protein n=1 Tax=Kribbella sp. VKM Ac-2568 TaxID=2512219 RepID=UPI00104428D8|nr:Hsp20/alpha crystallin family protein [Kribbella sp. VKM Ac-2568]TCM50620.1 HSP20 family molecular chaperone IbpA [Kribbella sp. VKM Ac-2568]
MTSLEHKDSRRQFADLFDWADSLPSLFTWPAAMRGVRIEEFADDNAYVVRAELPGLDPAKDIKVEVANGMMTITATRQQEEHDGARSEFHYGSLTRRVLLPDGADEAKVEAKYAAGILEVRVPITAMTAEARTIKVEHTP